MDCYTENVIKSIDRNLRTGAENEWFDRQEFLDQIIKHAYKRKASAPRRSSETRHGSGRRNA